MMNYKMIALDVDGTLLDDEHHILPLTRQTLRTLYKSGCQIVLCTGRGPSNTLPLLAELDMDGTVITHNGAVTVEMKNKRILTLHSFAMEEVMPLVAYCRNQGIHYDVNTVFEMYLDQMGENEQRMYDRFGIKPIRLSAIELLHEPLVKLTLFGDKPQMDQAEQDWQALGGELRFIRSGDHFIDIMNEQATKGRALQELSAMWNVPASEILAIGNYYNDLEMIEFAGMGIAMANSPDQVKARAIDVTDSNNHEGVHKALVKHCFAAG